jgi:hypothetical protein
VCKVLGIIDADGEDYYYFGLFDLEKGEVAYQRYTSRGFNLNIWEIIRELKWDLKYVSQ